MDTRFLESLIAVVEFGSIAEAARHQNITPAAVGQRIQSLEAELGTTLLQRAGQRSRPSESCLRIMPRIKAILEQVDVIGADLKPDELQGTLRLGAISTALTDYSPKILTELSSASPGIRLIVQPGTSRELYDAVRTRKIDAALIVMPPFRISKALFHVDLIKEPLVLISKTAPDNDVRTLLKTHPYIRYDVNSWGGQIAEKYRRTLNVNNEPFCDLDSLESIAALVDNGVGCSLVPSWNGLERFSGKVWISEPLALGFERRIVFLTHRNPETDAYICALRNAVGTAFSD